MELTQGKPALRGLCFQNQQQIYWDCLQARRPGTEILKNLYRPGFMWMPCLDGEHISFDVYVQKGSIEHVFDLVIPSEYNADGSFLIWEKVDSSLKQIEIASRFIRDYLRDWSGITNIEMIGNYILEIPLRTGTQFVDFYFSKWSQAVLELTGIKLPEGNQRSQNISYVVRSPIDSTLSSQSFSITPDQGQKIINLERSFDIKIYLPWKEGKALSQINHDGYSVRLAFINAPNINAARESWQHLRKIVFPEADLDEIEAF